MNTPSSLTLLLEKIRAHTATLGVCGLGYVGLPLAAAQAKAGFRVIALDTQAEKVAQVNAGVSYIGDVAGEELAALVSAGRLRATQDACALAACDCVCICVPTPLNAHRQPDLSHVRACAQSIAMRLHPGMLVVLESTTYPGTTQDLLRPMLEEASGLVCGADFFLAFSPERVDPGNRRYGILNTPKVVGGCTPACTQAACALYEAVLDAPVHRVSSPAVAEMEKLLENTYRSVNIALVNELARLCSEMGVSVWEVIDAAKTKPYGFEAFYPGPGPGGHCIPLDPAYLSWTARAYGLRTALAESAMAINDAQPAYCAERAARLLSRQGKSISGAQVLVLGVAYKADVADVRESPAAALIQALLGLGAQVRCYDPHVPLFAAGALTIASEPALDEALIRRADLVIVACDHSGVDYALVARCARAVLDTRNALRAIGDRHNIETL